MVPVGQWSMLLRIYGGITTRSDVLEIGCGRGRIAFGLRHMLSEGPTSDLTSSAKRSRSSRPGSASSRASSFTWQMSGTPSTTPRERSRRLSHVPSEDASRDIVFAASVVTHMLPENTAHYFHEAVRVLRPGGRFVFSAFLLDHYRAGRPRPLGFAQHDFDFDHAHGGHGRDFAIAFPDDPERMTAYGLGMLQRFAAEAGLELHDLRSPACGRAPSTRPSARRISSCCISRAGHRAPERQVGASRVIRATSASWPPPATADSRKAPAVRAEKEEHRELPLLDRFLDPVRHSIDVPGHEVEHGGTDRIDIPLFW